MRIRTFAGVLLALVAIVSVSFLVQLNLDLLQREFNLSSTVTVPVYVALLTAFLAGFLPTVGVLLTQTLRRDLAERRARRRNRQEKVTRRETSSTCALPSKKTSSVGHRNSDLTGMAVVHRCWPGIMKRPWDVISTSRKRSGPWSQK